jgi:chitinase
MMVERRVLSAAVSLVLVACGSSGSGSPEPDDLGAGGNAGAGGNVASGGSAGTGGGATGADGSAGTAMLDGAAKDGGRFATDQPFTTAYYTASFIEFVSPDEVRFDGLTHVVHFAAAPSQTSPYLTFDDLETGGQQAALLSDAHKVGTKVVLSVGGVYGDGSKAIEYAMADPARAQTFATTALSYAKDRGYDGLEIDYEPIWNTPAATKLATMSAVAKVLHDGLATWQPPGTLVLAVGGNRDMYSAETIACADQLNMMLYDMTNVASGACDQGAGCAQDVTGFNAPLHRPGPEYPALQKYSSSYDESDLPKWLAAGVPAAKLGAGIPLYAWIYVGKTAPGQSSLGVVPKLVRYDTVLDALANGGTRHWDDTSKVPWVAGTATGTFSDWNFSVAPGDSFYVTYDDPESLAAKVTWARQLGIGGVMLFDVGDGWSLAPPAGKAPDLLMQSVVSAMK